MSLLAQATRGKIKQPFLGICYGPDGCGKSTLGSEAPNPIFLGTERGTANLDVFRYPKESKTFPDVLEAITDLLENPHEFQTLVIDSLDWLEPLVWEHVVHVTHVTKGVESIEDYGYSKGYIYALDEWRKMIALLGRLRDERQMHIVLIAHCQVKDAKDPQVAQDYARYQLKLHDKAAALWREFVDGVYFLNFETLTAADKKGKVRAFGEGDRYLFTERRPAFDAKNRFGLPFQIEMTLGESWSRLVTLIEASNPQDPAVILKQIDLELAAMNDEELAPKVKAAIEKAAGNVAALERVLAKVRTYAKVA